MLLFDPFELPTQRQAGHLSVQGQPLAFGVGLTDGIGVGRREPRLEAQAARFVGAEPDHDHLVRVAGEDFACESSPADVIADATGGGGQVKFAAIVLRRQCVHEIEVQIAQRLVARPAAPQPFLGYQRVGFRKPPFGNQVCYRGEILGHIQWQRAIPRLVRGEGVLVQLQPLVLDTAEHHRPQAPVAQRQCLRPFGCRFGVPQQMRRIRSGG